MSPWKIVALSRPHVHDNELALGHHSFIRPAARTNAGAYTRGKSTRTLARTHARSHTLTMHINTFLIEIRTATLDCRILRDASACRRTIDIHILIVKRSFAVYRYKLHMDAFIYG